MIFWEVISLVPADSSIQATSVITLQNPPRVSPFLYERYFVAGFSAARKVHLASPQEKHHLLGVDEDAHALWKQVILKDLNFAFLQHWENTVLMLFQKAYATLIYAQKDTYLCTPNQSVGASQLHWWKLATHHGQELKNVHVPSLCTGATIKTRSCTATSLCLVSVCNTSKCFP